MTRLCVYRLCEVNNSSRGFIAFVLVIFIHTESATTTELSYSAGLPSFHSFHRISSFFHGNRKSFDSVLSFSELPEKATLPPPSLFQVSARHAGLYFYFGSLHRFYFFLLNSPWTIAPLTWTPAKHLPTVKPILGNICVGIARNHLGFTPKHRVAWRELSLYLPRKRAKPRSTSEGLLLWILLHSI